MLQYGQTVVNVKYIVDVSSLNVPELFIRRHGGPAYKPACSRQAPLWGQRFLKTP